MTKGRKTGGRRPGSINFTHRELKQGILAAYHAVGGQEWLMQVAKEDPRTFCVLLGKLIPAEIKAEVSGELTMVPVLNINRTKTPESFLATKTLGLIEPAAPAES